jgi:hypothetical protein
MDRDAQLIYEAYLAEADEELSTEVKGKADELSTKVKEKVHDEVKKAAEKVEKAGTDEITSAEKRKIKDIEDVINKKGEGMSALDKAQIALDVGGLASMYTHPTPVGVGAFVVGTASDATNAVISIARGVGSAVTGDTDNVKKHFANMGLSLLGLVPWVGDAAKAAKLSAKGIKHAKGASTLQKVVKTVKTGAKAGGKRLSRAAKSGGNIVHRGEDAGKLGGLVSKGEKINKGVKVARATAVKGALVGTKGARERGEDDELGPVIDVPGTVEPAPEENTALISPDHFRQRFARKVAA